MLIMDLFAKFIYSGRMLMKEVEYKMEHLFAKLRCRDFVGAESR